MHGKTITGTAVVDELLGEGMLGKTKQFKYAGDMASILVDKVKNNEPLTLPTVSTFADRLESYKKELLTLYNGTFGLFDGVNVVPDEIKVSQAAVLDSFCYGYDLEKGVTNIYTMRVDLFGNELDEKDLNKIMELNLKGEIKALKFSYEYKNNDNKVIDYKLGIHRTKIDDEESCVLVPFITGVMLLQLLEKFMSSGLVLKISQELANSDKIRCVTEKQEILGKYCDSRYAVLGLKSLYYPLDAFFYAPVIGAPSTTSMMTNINLFKVFEIKRLTNAKQLSEYGVQKPKDPIGVELEEHLICKYIMDLAEDEDSSAFEEFISALPKCEVLGEVDRSISERDIQRYLHAMKQADRNEIIKQIPGAKKMLQSTRDFFLDESREATEEEMQNPRIMFKSHICKVLIKKKDGTFSSMTCTNNKDLLESIYGENYFGIYESFGVRARALDEYLHEIGDSLLDEDIIKFYGFGGCSVDTLKHVAMKYKDSEEPYYNALYEIYGESRRESSPNNNILVRCIDGRFSKKKGKAEGYYTSVDMSKVQRVLVLG